jgi:DNA replication protein DnaC
MTTTSISPDLKRILRRLKLSPMLDTLPERIALARQRHMPHQDFLELVLSDEVSRRDAKSAVMRARKANLDPAMVLEAWDDTAKVTFDRDLWAELATLRFLEDANNVLVMGPVGVGKTFMTSALGNIACRRRHSVLMLRADRMLKRLKAARLDNSHDHELRKLIRVDLLILDDFCLHQLDHPETQDVYDIVVERHRRASTITTSNRTPDEWLATMADALLAQSAIDRLQSAAYELVIDGESYRRRQKPRKGGTR